MSPTPEKYFLKTWKVTDGGGTDVSRGEKLKIDKSSEGALSLAFPEGEDRFGDGLWDRHEDLLYIPAKGILRCKFVDKVDGPVIAEFHKFSKQGIRCHVFVENDDVQRQGQDPGEWVAEEEVGLPDPDVERPRYE